MKPLEAIIVALVFATVLVGVGIAFAQSGTSTPATANIAVRDGSNPGEVIVSWDAVAQATHYRIGYVNMQTDYPLAKSSVTGDWINAFIYVGEDARNLRVSTGRAEYTVRRLEQGVRHAFTVLTSSNFVDTGAAGSVSSEFSWPSDPRWEFHTVADRGGATAPAPAIDYVSLYPNCDAVRAHYPGGATQSSPIYRPELDPDGDGVACEPVSAIDIDRAALVALYNATDGANWQNDSNWLSDAPLGEWYGVDADRYGRVTGLSLDYNQLRGEIPADLANLVNLEVLDMSSNRLSGKVPAELGDLFNLERLELEHNHLVGKIPGELGNLSKLEILNLRGNRLSGAMPAELGRLHQLRNLELPYNRLSGAIPAEIGSLSDLRTLYLHDNYLNGEIPTELGLLANLSRLELARNRLDGRIPSELGNLLELTYLSLSDNQLSGEIPAELGRFPDCGAWCSPTTGSVERYRQSSATCPDWNGSSSRTIG